MSDGRRTAMSRRMLLLCCALLLAVVSGGPARAQGGGTGSVYGTVLGKADGAPVLSADVRVPRTGMRTRSDGRGTFRVTAAVGDSLIIRALGFAELRTVVQSSTPVVRLVALATVLPVFTTTMGQRVIRASESPRSVTVIGREEIDAVAAVSANQLLRQLPGCRSCPRRPRRRRSPFAASMIRGSWC